MTKEDVERIRESGEFMLDYIRENRADCTSCGGDGVHSLWFLEWQCRHCGGDGLEPLVKYKASGSAYIDFRRGID